MRKLSFLFAFLLLLSVVTMACSTDAPPTSAAVKHRDSVPMMTSYAVSKLISDSGIIRYKIITEEWRVFDRTKPPRQEFVKGILLERFNNDFRVDLYITADTAYCYDQNLWELRGRVRVRNEENGTLYRSQQLFWDMRKHEFHSNVYMRITTPDRDIQGDRFHSDEHMTRYEVTRSRGFIPMPNNFNSSSNNNANSTTDSTQTK